MNLNDARTAIIAPEDRTPEDWLRMGEECLNGESGQTDYEQAAFCFRQAKKLGNPIAETKLDSLIDSCKGVEIEVCSFDSTVSNQKDCIAEATELTRSRPLLDHDQARCPSCGAKVFSAHPHADGGYLCARDEGGCGGRLYLPIIEEGLAAGLAIQPFKQQQDPDVYSYFGRCIHEVKYNKELDDDAKRDMIAEAVKRIRECCVIDRLLQEHSAEDMLITPAPSSVNRKVKLVYLIAKGIALEHMEYAELLQKHSRTESKNRPQGTELMDGEMTCRASIGGRKVLLVDDTYGEGATLRACIRALKQSGAAEIYFLSLCRNIYGGMKGRL